MTPELQKKMERFQLQRNALGGDNDTSRSIRTILTQQPTDGTCSCGATVIIPAGIPTSWLEHPPLCAACELKTTEEADLEAKRAATQTIDQDRREAWLKLCPASFLETDMSKLPCGSSAISEVMSWEYGPRGMVFHGVAGTGKTRCAWMLLNREWCAGRSCDCITSMDMSFKVPSLYSSKDCSAVETYLMGLCKVGLLLLDDVFKSPLTERTEIFLFSLISWRVDNLLPSIFTLNDTSETLVKRMTQDRAVPMLRRIKEFSKQVLFTAK